MEIAILVFFLAIFGGIFLFLLGLVWFIFRRLRKTRSANRKFSGSSDYAGGAASAGTTSFDGDSGAFYSGYSAAGTGETQNFSTRDDASPSDYPSSSESHGAFAAPAETGSSSYESSSSYDSGSGSDSGSSSGESGGSSSSSD